jgi:hypothetical protein
LGDRSPAVALAGIDKLGSTPAVRQNLRVHQVIVNNHIASADSGSPLDCQQARVAWTGAYQEDLAIGLVIYSLLIGQTDSHAYDLRRKSKTHRVPKPAVGFG